MTKNFDAAWVQYLKNNQIAAMKSDPASGRLVYRRPVQIDDVATFLSLNVDIEEAEVLRIIERTVPQQCVGPTEADAQSGFVDLPGAEITERNIKSIFADVSAWLTNVEIKQKQLEEATQREQEQNFWVDGLPRVAASLTPEQRAAFVSMVLAMRSGLAPLSPQQIGATIKALVDEQRAAVPKKGFFRSLLSGKDPVTDVVDTDEIEERWVAAGAPIDESSFLSFLAANGYDRSRCLSALSQASGDTDAEVFASENAFRLMLDLAGKIKDADENKLLPQLEIIKAMCDDEDEVLGDDD